MKTIEQLLELSKNPYYKFTDSERVVLDDFLYKKSEESSQNSQKKNSTTLEKDMRVRVRNIVQKTIPRAIDAPEPSESLS